MDAASVPMPRKRNRSEGDRSSRPAKHVKRANAACDTTIGHTLLTQYYSEIQTLRQYVISKLPASSRLRRKKITSVGRGASPPNQSHTEEERAIGELLDSTIVASRQHAGDTEGHRWEQWVRFSQKGDESYVTRSDGLKGSTFWQSEIVDFVVWLLFSRETAGTWPKHLLCDGFRKQAGPTAHAGPQTSRNNIPGVYSVYPNQRVQVLKGSHWPQLLMLLGKEGERIMIDLLVDDAIFRAVKAGNDNLYQLSGTPISELEPLTTVASKAELLPSAAASLRGTELRPSEISFVRSRMLYARAALNARGLVHFGLRHIHVLNRFPYKPQSANEAGGLDESVVHIMMYIFPRQFGLHNVFTSAVNRQQTAQKLQDYTLREEEIANKFPAPDGGGKRIRHLPKRLRGTVTHLVQRLQVQHKRCAYAEMLQHYCPVPGQSGSKRKSQAASGRVLPSSTSAKYRKKQKPPTASMPDLQYTSLIELATPVSSVSAFCQAIMLKVIPSGFWGQGATQAHNKACFLKKVHHFIHLRRFESMCLHEVKQGMKVHDIEWLTPPRLGGQKSSQSDTQKRSEIFYEFLYYLFDSFLIPLIRSNFYVTESSAHRYQLFFFRHDVWRCVAEPAMASLKTNMFEEVRVDGALRILQSRRLGFSRLRLLPKQTTMRPIMNLRRRTLLQGDKKVLCPSINTIMGPVSAVLKLEKSLNPSSLGSSLFSVGDIYHRIKTFKDGLGKGEHEFYFAKVDVHAAFDTIPQDAMIDLLRRIPRQSRYRLSKHVEVKPLETASGSGPGVKVTKRWHTVAQASGDARTFLEKIEESLAGNKKDTVFIDSAVQKMHDTRDLLALTTAHIGQNLVRIGKKYYRQKCGIPQGSVLSSMLCNYFYADLERNHLGFLQADDCLLLRLIDDFLLITTDREKAMLFFEIMHKGLPKYGMTVNPGKSLANFSLTVRGMNVSRLDDGERFPYCGLWIDCESLAVAKQRDNAKDLGIFNSLTVEFSRCPGQNFKRKVINPIPPHVFRHVAQLAQDGARQHFHSLYRDSDQDVGVCAVYDNRPAGPGSLDGYASSSFVSIGLSTRNCLLPIWPYHANLFSRRWADTIKMLIDVSFVLLTSRTRRERHPGYVCAVRKGEVAWLAMVACRQILVRKQTGYRDVILWLEDETRRLSTQRSLDCESLVRAVKTLPAHQRG
ncbi:Telomerase reverse transcriptase [Madurella mycetomatis]|uniref:Telomerase reverse transcriptase n=1 Tax=Madurella mycetomatis TaxID=100816 RepID=A0A175VUP4_9PEZI|nr:Telomerase reverse transcriptase [Madurella mycetomatis]